MNLKVSSYFYTLLTSSILILSMLRRKRCESFVMLQQIKALQRVPEHSIFPLKGGTQLNQGISEREEKAKAIESLSSSSHLHYPTAGGMYDISEGPGHHLINVDHDKLDDLGDKSVNVHEVQLDAVTVTFLSFAFLALSFFVFAFSAAGGLNNAIARIQNFLT